MRYPIRVRTFPLFAVLAVAASCASVEAVPHRACFFDGGNHFRAGTVIEKRSDGSRLFRYDDRSEGDHGYQWVADDDTRLKPCHMVDPMSAEQSRPEASEHH